MGASYVVVPSSLSELESASAGPDQFDLNALGAWKDYLYLFVSMWFWLYISMKSPYYSCAPGFR